MRIEVILNSDAHNTKSFTSEVGARAYAKEKMNDPNIVDIAIYDLNTTVGKECIVSWSRINGVWENFKST